MTPVPWHSSCQMIRTPGLLRRAFGVSKPPDLRPPRVHREHLRWQRMYHSTSFHRPPVCLRRRGKRRLWMGRGYGKGLDGGKRSTSKNEPLATLSSKPLTGCEFQVDVRLGDEHRRPELWRSRIRRTWSLCRLCGHWLTGLDRGSLRVWGRGVASRWNRMRGGKGRRLNLSSTEG